MTEWKDVEKEARELCEKATPGPWYKQQHCPNNFTIHTTKKYDPCESILSIGYDLWTDPYEYFKYENDAKFISMARTALPLAISELDARQKRIEELEATVKKLHNALNGSMENMFERDKKDSYFGSR